MLDENFQVFQKNYPDWIKVLHETKTRDNYVVENTRTGAPTLKVEKDGKVYLYHSKYDPVREAEKLLSMAVKEEPEILVIGGFGLGYVAEEALKIFKSCQVVVCDFDREVLKTALSHRNLSGVFASERVHFVLTDNPQAVIEILKPYKTTNLKLLVHQPSSQMYPEFYEKLKVSVDHYLNAREINVATLNRFQKLWTRNILKNLKDFILNKGVSCLFDEYVSVPCVIVAAGPSLCKNIELVREVKDNGIIIAVDTSFQILQAHDIDPDIVIAVDPQDINKKYFENIRRSEAILVCEPSISPKIVRQYEGRKLMMSSLFHLVEWIESFTEKKGEIDIGGSVATGAFGLAMKMGCDPISFVGLDLAYSESQTHMKGAYFEESSFYRWNRFENSYGTSRKLLSRIGLFDVEGHGGGVVKSDRKFHMFQKWFESKFEKSGRRIIDSTEGGSRKNHCDALPFVEVVREYMSSGVHRDKVMSLGKLKTVNEETDKLLAGVVTQLEEVLQEFYRLEKVGRKGKRLSEELCGVVEKCVKYNKPYPRRLGEIHFELDKLDRAITENTTINALISITIQNIINSSHLDDSEELITAEKEIEELQVSKRTLKLYEGIVDGILFNIEQFSRCLVRLKGIMTQG